LKRKCKIIGYFRNKITIFATKIVVRGFYEKGQIANNTQYPDKICSFIGDGAERQKVGNS
jgi:hypothetical protein